MDFVIGEGPENGPQLVERNAPIFVYSEQPQGGSLEIALPQPIYTVTTPAVRNENILASARLTAWQYVVTSEDEPVAVIELEWDEDREIALYASQAGPVDAARIVDAIAFSENLPQVQDRQYELRMLRAPGLDLFTVWLRAMDRVEQDSDLLVAVVPAPTELGERRVFDEKELAEALGSLATIRLTGSDIR